MTLPRITDPRAIPVVGDDAHLPPVADERLSVPALRQRFADAAPWVPPIAGDGRLHHDREPSPAAVLVALVARDDGLRVLLTRRTDHLRDHAGQISFPGGRTEPEDGGPAATALREAQEEVGLAPTRVDVIGQLPVYTTITRYVVTPVVALVQPPLALQLDAFEVAEAFEVPLAFLMNPAHHRRHHFHYEGGQRQFLSMPWQGPGADGVEREYFIWGATAAMLRNLYHFLAD
ncbi:DNA mismatch repair protein MutT [Rubrivivax sp. A210]|uniref:CoA pyrophosphatase n=1 Tax=Rubrivivax sp. A210 TaxID=2772301 RepID=UPI001918A6F0|nr:CoA pyrophosphatase [Rubrivivax sp. A210]CAD5373857.1 DNA mismatch repair protein MutT [Rubrivivax sp. A210]